MDKNIESCKFAYTPYKKVISELESYLRGLEYDEDIFLSKLQTLDDIVVDLSKPINGVSKNMTRYTVIYNG